MGSTILRLPEVIKRTGLSRSAIYEKIQHRAFPQQVKLSVRSMGFVEAEVDEWIDDKANARR